MAAVTAVTYAFEAIPVWPYEQRKPRPHHFTGTWQSTMDIVSRELRHLRMRGSATLRVVTTAANIRLDGMLRSDARVDYHGVVLEFDSMYGRLLYPCDTYSSRGGMPGWQANLRAIGLSLEALRAADRHGVATHGEQYRGWTAIEPGTSGGTMPFYDAASAEAWLRNLVGDGVAELSRCLRYAKKMSHPDVPTGNLSLWGQVVAAESLLAADGRV